MYESCDHGAIAFGAVIERPDQSTLIKLRGRLPMLSPDAPRVWVNLAMEGDWFGHPTGPFRFDGDTFERIVANFRRQQNPVPFTYEHPEKDHGQPIPAAAWIDTLEIRNCAEHGLELWGHAEFTRRAASMVREGEYRFCSVVVDLEATDRMSGDDIGAALFEVGMTNTPFLDGQHPIKLSGRAGRRKEKEMADKPVLERDILARLLKEAKDQDDLTLEQLFEAAKAERSKGAALRPQKKPAESSKSAPPERSEHVAAASDEAQTPKALAEDAPEKEGDGGATEARAVEFLMAWAAQRGVPLEQLLSELEAKAADLDMLLDGGGAAPMAATAKLSAAETRALRKQIGDRDSSLKKLTHQIEQLEGQVAQARVDRMVYEGLILEDDRDELIMLAQQAPKVFELRCQKAAKSPAVPTAVYKPQGAGDREGGFEHVPEEWTRSHEQALKGSFRSLPWLAARYNPNTESGRAKIKQLAAQSYSKSKSSRTSRM